MIFISNVGILFKEIHQIDRRGTVQQDRIKILGTTIIREDHGRTTTTMAANGIVQNLTVIGIDQKVGIVQKDLIKILGTMIIRDDQMEDGRGEITMKMRTDGTKRAGIIHNAVLFTLIYSLFYKKTIKQ